MNRARGFLKVLSLALALAAPLSKAEDSVVVQIGFSGPLSGMSEAYGRSLFHAAQLAVDQANSPANAPLNVIDGKSVRFVLAALDDKQDMNMSILVAKYFVQSEVVGVIGNTNTTNSLATSAIFDEAHLAHISPASSGRNYTRMGHRSAFRVVGHDEQAIYSLVPYLLGDMHAKKIAIISNETLFGMGISGKFEKALQDFQKPAFMRENISGRTYDFNAVLDHIQEAGVDYLFFGGNAEQAAMLARSMQRKGVTARLISAMAGTAGDNFLKVAGTASEGVIALEYGVPPDKMTGWKKFYSSFNTAYADGINPFTVCSYDATNLLIEAVREANSTDRKKIVEQLHNIKYKGVSGNISFDETGDLLSPTFTVYQVSNLKWQPIKVLQTSKH